MVCRDSDEQDDGVIIGNGVWIGRGAVIMRGVVIGDGSIIGAGEIITEDVPPYAIIGAIPARPTRPRFAEYVAAAMPSLHWRDFQAVVRPLGGLTVAWRRNS